jgi:ubiquinone/menaquinone biosynthesis C-methylase UbiE
MSSSQTRSPDFGARAGVYDELRPGIPGLDEALVEAGDLRGRRVLDMGCGTGRFAEALATSYEARVFGVDAEPAMLAVARRRKAGGVAFKQGRVERLPFKDGWFERATMVLVCHLVERVVTFAEVRRVLAEQGRFVLATFDRGYFSRYYLNEYFPSMLEVDLGRFPGAEQLESELGEAGFAGCEVDLFSREAVISRAEALARIRGRHISTFDLIGQEEYERGLERAECELPAEIQFRYDLLIVSAAR